MSETAGQRPGGVHTEPSRLDSALKLTYDYFATSQDADGYWVGELETNSTIEAEYLMMTKFVGSDEGERFDLVMNDIVDRQLDDGSWNMYYGGPGDVSTTVECYFALKLRGFSADEPNMVAAREFILAAGGVPAVRVFTKIWLALFGQWDWSGTPSLPPELILLPTNAPFNIYRFSSWARGTIVPLMVILSKQPTMEIPRDCCIDELYPLGRAKTDYSMPMPAKPTWSWEHFFWRADSLLGFANRHPIRPLRDRALAKIERWLVDHQELDGSWAGIQPPWVNSLVALHLLGRDLDDPVMKRGLDGFRHEWTQWSQDRRSIRVQCCVSPVWDTALALVALEDAGTPLDDPTVQLAARWLVGKEVLKVGDWAVNMPHAAAGGWPFEYYNDMYADVDDTSVVIIGLDSVELTDAHADLERRGSIERGIAWIVAMQCSNGGWASFDKDNDDALVPKIPFSDFGEVLDPPSVDVTAHVLEMFGRLVANGRRLSPAEGAAVRRGREFVLARQEDDGSWFGRWGVNFVYGVGAVLPALRALGDDMSSPHVRRGVGWLSAHQNDDGGWGETCASYVDVSLRGVGDSTASQTAWALLALVAAGQVSAAATARGVDYLLDTQRHDGTWDEPQYTGCGFPGYGIGDQPDEIPAADPDLWQGHELGAAFMINYHLYRNYFPLMALGRVRSALKSKENA